MKRIHVTLSTADLAKLKAHAKAAEVPASEIVRRALSAYLKGAM